MDKTFDELFEEAKELEMKQFSKSINEKSKIMKAIKSTGWREFKGEYSDLKKQYHHPKHGIVYQSNTDGVKMYQLPLNQTEWPSKLEPLVHITKREQEMMDQFLEENHDLVEKVKAERRKKGYSDE